ncbi:GTPase activating protein [Grosmannia clavigera kw1407]|uniref:GTPase activating protein n=1 Tax=Grosmannia clavigera (strain kw1407 / UAMH 11150) TaxID=655863 RepID=F0XLQ4_GROCL|nr:GTPase activating protein [Grosmannia clavigera kw1407]EFX01363.1 GTPase activating protein [Grosmannia clavigera kw1407]
MFSSSGHGKKPPSQQEMVQVDRADSASPFWRAPPREPAGKKGGGKSGGSSNSNSNSNNMRDPTKVVGAAYSHADLLKFDSLSLSGSPSRPRSPPPSTSHKTKTHGSGSSSSGSKAPPFRNYKSFLSNTDEDWNADEEEDVYGYDEDDGDDFGLPSLSNMKRRTRRMAAAAAAAQSGSGRLRSSGDGDVGWGAVEEADDGFGSRPPNSATQQQQQRPRRYSNSADIAVERPAPSYPVPKKSEGKILRPQYKDILRDPANALHLISHAAVPAGASAKEAEAVSARISRINKFKKLLQASTIPLPELRALAWSGIPHEVRAMTWQLLLSYLPTSSERRVAALERKRREYLDGVRQAFDGVGGSGSGGGDTNSDGDKAGANRAGTNRAGANRASAKGRGLDEAVWHQISIDVPRTNPHMELYGFEATQRSLERILYVWAVRHPASGYVQGINDLVTPFWQVFLGVYISDPNIESGMDPGQLPRAVLDAVEADSFWCLTKLLDGIQDHYIVAQPGIQRQVAALRDLTARIDSPLARHLEDEHVEFIQFSFRWMNCLLMREISVKNTIRMWDTYMAEENGFSEFHLYVCAAFLVKWSAKLCGMDFQEIMMFLQSLPTREWTEKDIELLLSEAYIWQSLFKGSSAHLRRPASRAPSTNLQL